MLAPWISHRDAKGQKDDLRLRHLMLPPQEQSQLLLCRPFALSIAPSGCSQFRVWLCVATFPVKTYCLLLPSFAWEPFYSEFIGWAGGRMGGNHCMHPVMCRNSRKGRMVHSCSTNDSSTSYLCFLKMKGPLNKEVYGKACVCWVPAPAF